MRDLARSMIRFSWAMSMFGARQAANLVSPRDGWDRSADTFDAVSHAARDQMGETMRGFYKAGDRLQSGMVDTMARLFRGTWSDPGKTVNEMWEQLDRTWTGMKEDLTQGSTEEE